VQHLLGEAADTVNGFKGIFVGGHGVEVIEGVGFCPFPIFYKLILDLSAGNFLGGSRQPGYQKNRRKNGNRFGD
jgi:hypothetical protein